MKYLVAFTLFLAAVFGLAVTVLSNEADQIVSTMGFGVLSCLLIILAIIEAKTIKN